MKFGENIQLQRENHNMSQQELADILGGYAAICFKVGKRYFLAKFQERAGDWSVV